jgi:hypothetical protein
MAKSPDDADSIARADGYNAQTGKIDGREAAGLKWINERTTQLKKEGLSTKDAAIKALSEARANGRMDWRVGDK